MPIPDCSPFLQGEPWPAPQLGQSRGLRRFRIAVFAVIYAQRMLVNHPYCIGLYECWLEYGLRLGGDPIPDHWPEGYMGQWGYWLEDKILEHLLEIMDYEYDTGNEFHFFD
jgi:hypothetical protein